MDEPILSVVCMDCQKPSAPMDFVIPRIQWLLIHPEDDGYLCANCMVLRANKLPGVINITGVITFADDYEDGKEHPYEWASKRVGGDWERHHDLSTAEALRARGWMVAVHNDYRLKGESYTFWLFTKDNRCAKGEGRTDREALARVVDEINRLWGPTG